MNRSYATLRCLLAPIVAALALQPVEASAGVIDTMGWLDVILKMDSRVGAKPFFDTHHVYLINQANLSDSWKVFVEIEWEHLPKFESDEAFGELKMERAYAEQRLFARQSLRYGKFNTPFGRRIPTHWQILTPVISKPIHENNEYVPVKSVGVSWLGSVALSSSNSIEYSVFISNGAESSGTNHPLDGLTGQGMDVSLVAGLGNRIGVSAYHQRNPFEDRDEFSLVVYGELMLAGMLELRGEYFEQARDWEMFAVSSGYAVAKFTVPRAEALTLAYRYGRGVDEKSGGGVQQEQVANVSYQLSSAARVAIEGTAHHFTDESVKDYVTGTLWLGVNF